MAAFPFEGMHDLADAIDATPSILRLAVPAAPAQALDLRDDHRLAFTRSGPSVDKPLAACAAYCIRMAM
jgi:hypothetical protein